MTTTPAIETAGLTKRFGDFTAVQDVSLQIGPGEIFGFLGPNGAGKSTTIRCLLDLIRPSEGECRIVGLDSRRDAVEIRRHLGFLPSDLALYPNLTGRETLQFLANLRGGVDWAWVDALADRFDADLVKKVGELSSGNRQKVGLIQAFMNRPEVVILDEPITGLDPLVQLEFHTLMREHVADGNTVFLSSHTLSEVERVADRVGFIRRGHLIAVERMSDLLDKALRRVRLEFASPVPASAFDGVEGVHGVAVEGASVTAQYEGSMGPLLRVATAHDVLSLESSSVDLDEIFLEFYRDELTEAEAV
ncbi:ABC transporter ATP-binding protein [Demequina lignilytica]|uniref:ABC transporter ATP-binding protein n=1 Tax=Demequina lignilytica TaxID=3051663 RepID=A0AAW7M4Z3_9MICO|nr:MULTISPECIES: ABC transporter ATP-binding protein [unclassified Demequina]MDN4478612.1 ABC transporter ATP-binding protein [Demequina sp. SYSU T00039-1]MDN4483828.1 ABC transporter ATP-binding protein [Demequina sp. SYSU T0a273]MDN4488590.1 ABC transporter ATP-binding protein [Demequina sp. SYSU T00039]MDN4491616.1 ABC transporter ATP-binding protein [Demequina sp. SYSU T00068]